jgi:hypothetical protein
MTTHDEQAARGSVEHEHSDVSVRGIVMTAAGLLVVAIVVHAAMAGVYVWLERRAAGRDAPVSTLLAPGPRFEPRPRLQANPSQDLKTFREEQRLRLYGYGWVDQADGVVHIPIDRAMTLMLERGYAVQAGGTAEPGRALGSSSGRFAPRGEP